ncbi:DUF3572 family protein [Faunimonas sp. B44]|uniref:DUF3572 family protein n=1 Tax=Faunimonas sp. B44 TaxID=3461493 RepID=UPI0040441BD2
MTPHAARAATEEAEEIAVAAFGYIASDERLRDRFLAVSGLTPEGIRSAAREDGFLAGVLAFLMEHEPSLLAFAESSGLAPSAIAAAAARLAPTRPAPG